MKSRVVSTAILALTLPAMALATDRVAEEKSVNISGNIALASDYKFRGISQTDSSPALQGGFDMAFGNGFYLGTWGSNVDFANSLELDYYGGLRGNVTPALSFDIGYLYYDYPSSPDDDPYGEAYGKLAFSGMPLGLAFSDHYYLESGKFLYTSADYATEVRGFRFNFHLAHNAFDSERFLNGTGDSYLDYSFAVSRACGGVDWKLSLIDTNLEKAECFGQDWCDLSAVISVSKALSP